MPMTIGLFRSLFRSGFNPVFTDSHYASSMKRVDSMRGFCQRTVFLFFRFFHVRLINAERFLVQIIAGGRERPRAATHANVAEFAAAALAFQVVAIAKLLKYRGVLPDFFQALLMEIARHRQITAGINFASIGDERHARAGQAAFGHGLHVPGGPRRSPRAARPRAS